MGETVIAKDDAQKRLIRREDYVSCALAFIDCKTPGSHLKQNYSIIGPGVTTSADQVVNLREPHGFNIGAAAMPHGIVNNLHIHFTAEVFMVFKGAWKFRWGPEGKDGEITGEAGDIASIPTWIFRGFVNVGPDDGWLFTTLGGDDTGGIIWHPSILAGAAGHGMYLTRDNMLVDTTAGAKKPAEVDLIVPIGADQIAKLRRYGVDDMRARVVAKSERQWSGHALLDSALPGHASAMAPVIGFGITQDRDQQAKIVNPHGFSMEWLKLAPGQSVSRFKIAEKMVLIQFAGVTEAVLNGPGAEIVSPLHALDTLSIPGDVWRSLRNAGDSDAEVLVICSGDQRKHPHFAPDVLERIAATGHALDKSGFIAPAHLLPGHAPGRN